MVTDRATLVARRRTVIWGRGLEAQDLASPGSWWPAAAGWGRGGGSDVFG
jgi:hypothetical protein